MNLREIVINISVSRDPSEDPITLSGREPCGTSLKNLSAIVRRTDILSYNLINNAPQILADTVQLYFE